MPLIAERNVPPSQTSSNTGDSSFLFEKAAEPSSKGGYIEWPPLFVIRGNRYLIVIDCEKVVSEFGRFLKFTYLCGGYY